METLTIHNYKGQTWTRILISLILFIDWEEDEG